MKREHWFLLVIFTIFIGFVALFSLLPRSSVSRLERRKLMEFPEFSADSLASGAYTSAISSWFSDTQPYRDTLLEIAMAMKDRMALKLGDQVTFHAGIDPTDDMLGEVEPEDTIPPEPTEQELEQRNRRIDDVKANVTLDTIAKTAARGIIISGTGDNVRALMVFGGSEKGGASYAKAANEFKRVLGSGVNVYCVVIPTSIEFYCPENLRSSGKIRPQLPTIRNIYANLSDSVHAVDVYSPLAAHANEPIYLRTDHHWSPLGAYYAAQAIASVAKVPFWTLDHYTPRTIKRFVGTMYAYSRDASVKNAPEDFTYYIPKDTTYSATFVYYTLNDSTQKVAHESRPVKSAFFKRFKDGSGAAYSTFMGGDHLHVKVTTSAGTGRKIAIIKDSFGNAIPGYLFGSFDEVHVLDFRYFPHNFKKYVAENGITDVALCTNIFNSYSPSVAGKFRRMLTR